MKQKHNQWYHKFFHKYYLKYFDIKLTAEHTRRDVRCIRQALCLSTGTRILDLACGTGRHSVALAKAGFEVTGMDLEPSYITQARQAAQQARVHVRWQAGDMRKLPFIQEFDAVICMFSSFGYFERKRDNFQVLKSIARVLRPSGRLLLDLPNMYWMLTRVKTYTEHRVGLTRITERRTYNKRTHRYLNTIYLYPPKGCVQKTCTFMYLYSVQDITAMLYRAGFSVKRVYGDYQRRRYHTKQSPRLIIVAETVQ